MVSISYFLQFVALLLFFVSVHCEYFVGHGNHILVNETITKLNINTMIAETKEDIERYMNLVNSCDVTMDNEGNIILWYKENSNTMKNGCSADFVTKKEGQISLEFGIKGNLTECISCFENEIVDFENFTDNMLSFAYSLKNYELNEIKDGPKNGSESDCRNVTGCVYYKGNCLRNTPFYSIGWLKIKEDFIFVLIGVGDTVLKGNKVKNQDKQNISSTLILKGDMFIQPNITTSCYKKHQKLKEWEIKDKDYNYNNKNFTSLFNFHIMPINSLRKTIQKMVLNCNNDDKREICNNETTMQKCDKMFIKFDKEHFKLLVPDTIPMDAFTSESESNSIEASESIGQTRTKRTRKPKVTDVPETEETGISLIAIILIGVGILIFLSSIISIIIWLFVCRGNEKEEEKEQLPYINSTQPTNTNSEETDVNYNPSFNLNEANDDSPATVVQTQMDRFGDASTVVETQMDLENSKILGGVEVPETTIKVENEEDEVKGEEDNI